MHLSLMSPGGKGRGTGKSEVPAENKFKIARDDVPMRLVVIRESAPKEGSSKGRFGKS